MIQRSRSQQGSVILYAMLAMTVMLTISLALTGLLLSKLRSSQQASSSVVAVYVANSATELCLYEARNEMVAPSRPTFTNGATFQIINTVDSSDVTATCAFIGSQSFSFRAAGSYRGIRRSLEVSQ